MRINGLAAGDLVIFHERQRAVFIGMVKPHPLFSLMALVIWYNPVADEWYHDALLPDMELAPETLVDTQQRGQLLRLALTPGNL